MHHVSKDKRSRCSAELIYQGLVACLAKKPFDQVTISDVQRASGVARSTFYRCFDNMADVLAWRCEMAFTEALSCQPPCDAQGSGTMEEPRILEGYFAYWAQNPDVLELLLTAKRQNLVYDCHLAAAKKVAETHGGPPNMPENDLRYFMPIRTSVTIGVLGAWLASGRKETPRELVNIVSRQVMAFAGLLAEG